MKSNLKLLIALIVFAFISATSIKAQDFEIGAQVGASQYMGDLTYSHIAWKETKPGLGAFMRYYFGPRFNFKGHIQMGWIEGYDGNKPKIPQAAYERELHFQSHLLEFAGILEFNILPYVSGNRIRNWAPYIYTGIAVFNFDPKTEFNGKIVRLQPLGTEGQGLPGYSAKYNLTQISIPYGIGFKYSFKRPKTKRGLNMYLWNIGVFASQNKTFTDHLDDVGGYFPNYDDLDGGPNGMTAQLSDRQGTWVGSNYMHMTFRQPGKSRGNPEANDQYMWVGFTISKTLRKNTCFCF